VREGQAGDNQPGEGRFALVDDSGVSVPFEQGPSEVICTLLGGISEVCRHCRAHGGRRALYRCRVCHGLSCGQCGVSSMQTGEAAR